MVVKKNTIKKPTKKIVSKKTISPKKQFKAVSGELCFWVNNGPILCSIKDLHDALVSMSDDQFKHHVNKQKNDFALWVQKALLDDTSAKRLFSAKDRKSAIKALSICLESYK